MDKINEEQLKLEIAHIFDSGANELRVFEMVKNFIDSRNVVNKNFVLAAVISSVCDCEPHTFYEWEKDENKCSQCGKKIYEQTVL
jgi:hypothetical protein